MGDHISWAVVHVWDGIAWDEGCDKSGACAEVGFRTTMAVADVWDSFHISGVGNNEHRVFALLLSIIFSSLIFTF